MAVCLSVRMVVAQQGGASCATFRERAVRSPSPLCFDEKSFRERCPFSLFVSDHVHRGGGKRGFVNVSCFHDQSQKIPMLWYYVL